MAKTLHSVIAVALLLALSACSSKANQTTSAPTQVLTSSTVQLSPSSVELGFDPSIKETNGGYELKDVSGKTASLLFFKSPLVKPNSLKSILFVWNEYVLCSFDINKDGSTQIIQTSIKGFLFNCFSVNGSLRIKIAGDWRDIKSLVPIS